MAMERKIHKQDASLHWTITALIKKNVSYKFDSALNRKTTGEIVWQKM